MKITRTAKQFSALFRRLLIVPILIYQKLISPGLPGSCIYYPSCSEYAKQSFLRFGLFRGAFLSLLRIFRCSGGLFSGGEDPVPPAFSLKAGLAKYKEYRRRT
jgi:hypothetical protein